MERRGITLSGVVQGVGFRPFVYRLASQFQLGGFVKNQAGSVLIEVEGKRASIARFLDALQSRPPPLSRIDAIQCRALPIRGNGAFCIEPSDNDLPSQVFISPDVATCADCLAELEAPNDRRYQYPFLNCTNCGPRLTIITGAPYDRERTTMAQFVMCAACAAEYENPGDRRFHAQPTACPACGPRLELLDARGATVATVDGLACFALAILRGEIGALKGLGGFHLVCDARNQHAVGELRRRKHRDEKPFAVMVRDVESARRICELGSREQHLLQSHNRPIVLLRRRAASGAELRAAQRRRQDCTDLGSRPFDICAAVAPGNPWLGIMLPYTPLHDLLMKAVGGVPLVMTSGNRSDEPIAYLDEDAVTCLSGIADLFLTHNRPIHIRCDDSVTRIVDGKELPVRRSRGYAPQPLRLPLACLRPLLAVGGQFKSTFALGRAAQAFLSHHLGDLDHFAAYQAFQRDVRLYEELFGIQPNVIVHDLHPDYASTGYARRRAAEEGLELLAVQHHHAHMASCMAENRLNEPAIGVSFDGTGFGTDEAIWGGEFLVGDYARFFRAAHLRYIRLPGGDRAVREPWRVGVSHLLDAGFDHTELARRRPTRADLETNSAASIQRVTSRQLLTIQQMIERNFNSPLASSAGRLFDAVAAITGVMARASYEGQAAMNLEHLATAVAEDGTYPFELTSTNHVAGSGSDSACCGADFADKDFSPIHPLCTVDTRPLIRAVVHDVRRGRSDEVIARRFHSTIVEIIAAVCARIRTQTHLDAVVLSGGVFMNVLLTRETCRRLKSDGFRVYRHQLVPPNDGGLSLGQLAIAAKMVDRADGVSEHEQPGAPPACATNRR